MTDLSLSTLMDVEIPEKLSQWKGSMAYSTLTGGEVPELPRITIKDFVPEDRLVIKAHYKTREWEICNTGGCNRTGTDFEMKRCVGCHHRRWRCVRYCSMECQRADWSTHKLFCGTLSQPEDLVAREALSTLDPEVAMNCLKRQNKRMEGLSAMAGALFHRLCAAYPNINLYEMALSVYCVSSDQGRGTFLPLHYRLEPVADTEYYEGCLRMLQHTEPATKVGIVQVWIDKVYHRPLYIGFRGDVSNDSSLADPFWPWTFAAAAQMANSDAKLAGTRMKLLNVVVDTLARHKWPGLLQFKGPTNFDNGELWSLYGFEEWKAIFGHVVGF